MKVFRYVVPFAFMLFIITFYIFQEQLQTTIQTEAEVNVTLSTPKISLHSAVINGDLEIIEQHIHSGSDLNIKEPSGGSSPLILAALLGKTDIAIALIEAGANVNQTNNEGSTPLHTAAFFCRPEIVKALLTAEADISLRNNSGTTALGAVSAPFQTVKSVYDYFGNTLGPIGLELDYDYIKITRPEIAEMLQQ